MSAINSIPPAAVAAVSPFVVTAFPEGFTDFFSRRVQTTHVGGAISRCLISRGLEVGRMALSGRKLSTLRAMVFNTNIDREIKPSIERVTIVTPKEISLDGVLIHGGDFNSESPDYASRKVIYFAMGIGGIYEAMADPHDAARDFAIFLRREIAPNVDVLTVNYEGLVPSQAGVPSYENWALDNYCALKFLQARGYQPRNMLVFGHSMGGWHSVRPLAWFRAELPADAEGPSFVSYNSFADLSDASTAAMGAIGPRVTRYFGWDDSIKDTLLTFPVGKVCISYNEGDPFITAPFRLATKVSETALRAAIIPSPPDRTSHQPSPHQQCPGLEVANRMRAMLGITTAEPGTISAVSGEASVESETISAAPESLTHSSDATGVKEPETPAVESPAGTGI